MKKPALLSPSGRNLELDKKSVSPPSSEDKSRPVKIKQLAGRAQRGAPSDLPMIDELAEGKENDTFAVAPPLPKQTPIVKKLEEAHKARQIRSVSRDSSQNRNG